jgi:hypothetical protein
MRQIANGTHIKTDKNPLAHGVLGSYEICTYCICAPLRYCYAAANNLPSYTPRFTKSAAVSAIIWPTNFANRDTGRTE